VANRTDHYGDFANGISWSMNELCFRAQAAASLLHESEADVDSDNNLLGVSEFRFAAITSPKE